MDERGLRQWRVRLLALTRAQAEDDGLWFVAQTAPEAYLQRELRRLHAMIEGGPDGCLDDPILFRERLKADWARTPREYSPPVKACCFCGADTQSGIYVRHDPKRLVYCPGGH